MTLGDKLRSLRLKTRKTLEEQSALLKVSMNSVYRWEHDMAVPRRSVLKMMSDYYGVPFDWLMADASGEAMEQESENNLISMFRKLPDATRYKVLGYVERICVEESSAAYKRNEKNGRRKQPPAK